MNNISEDLKAHLAGLSLFSALTSEQLEQIVTHTRVVEAGRGTVLGPVNTK